MARHGAILRLLGWRSRRRLVGGARDGADEGRGLVQGRVDEQAKQPRPVEHLHQRAQLGLRGRLGRLRLGRHLLRLRLGRLRRRRNRGRVLLLKEKLTVSSGKAAGGRA